VGGILGVCLVIAGCLLLFGREDYLLPTFVAALVCLIPAFLTLQWALRSGPRSPVGRLQDLVVGSAARITLTGAAAMGTWLLIDRCRSLAFVVALLGFYMLALALETGVLIRHSDHADNTGR
jgi:hypothetical protein